MRLEDYWGIGPKTRDLLADELGVEAAIAAIEAGDADSQTRPRRRRHGAARDA